MNIQDIINSNDSILLNKYQINIKIFLLDLIKKNLLDNKKYENLINFFILKKDKNFCDSLNCIEICNILYNSLNNPHTVNMFNSNQIIISKSLDIFNNINFIKYSELIINLNSSIYSNQNLIKNQLIRLDENNINISLEVLDNIYSSVLEGNYKIFSILYARINKIILLNRIEIQNRINEITVILKLIYKLVLKEDLNLDHFDLQEFINMLSIISIIKLKIDDILIKKNISIDKLFNDQTEHLKEYLKEILKIFNNDECEINTESINNIKGVIHKYDKIVEILNNPKEPIEYIEQLYNEYKQCIQLKEISINNIDQYLINFIRNIKEFIELYNNVNDDIIDEENDDANYDDLHLDLLFELNKQISEMFQEIKNDSNIQVYYNRSEECNVNSEEYSYLKHEITKIDNILDDIYFNNFNEICYINLKKNNIIRKINKLINLQNLLEKNLTKLSEPIEFNKENNNINLNLINEELKKEINSNNTLLEEHKLLLIQKINSLKN